MWGQLSKALSRSNTLVALIEQDLRVRTVNVFHSYVFNGLIKPSGETLYLLTLKVLLVSAKWWIWLLNQGLSKKHLPLFFFVVIFLSFFLSSAFSQSSISFCFSSSSSSSFFSFSSSSSSCLLHLLPLLFLAFLPTLLLPPLFFLSFLLSFFFLFFFLLSFFFLFFFVTFCFIAASI